MTSYLYERKIRIFDYPRFAEPFRNRLRENAERLAAESGIEIEFLRKRNVRKEDLVKAILAKRGERRGLVCILSAMEPCSTYKPWHNKRTLKLWVRRKRGNKVLTCSGGGGRCRKIKETRKWPVRHLPWRKYQTVVFVEHHRIRCPKCGLKVEVVPQLPSKALFSKLQGQVRNSDPGTESRLTAHRTDPLRK